MISSTRSLVAAVVAMLMLLAACSDDSATSVTTTSTSGPTTSSSTTTTTAPTTLATIDPVAEAEAAIEESYYRSFEVWNDCNRALPDCEPAEVYAEVYTGGLYARLVDAVNGRKADGVIYEAPVNPEHTRVELYDIEVSDDLTTAEVTYCSFNGDAKLVINADGSRTPVGPNDTILVDWGKALYKRTSSGSWLAFDYVSPADAIVEVPFTEIDQQIEGGKLCGQDSSGT